jgi:hypothetical protein
MQTMRSLGWNYPINAKSWSALRQAYEELVAQHAEFHVLVAIIASIEESDCAAQLAGTTSMHDLVVVAAPIPDPPMDVIIVRAPTGTLRAASPGMVLIEHNAVSGRNDRIERPASDAVALFWRFVLEKFGISATR